MIEFHLGGAFKTMPVSPKDMKSATASGGGTEVIESESENQSDVKASPPTVFTFTSAPLSNSKWTVRCNEHLSKAID